MIKSKFLLLFYIIIFSSSSFAMHTKYSPEQEKAFEVLKINITRFMELHVKSLPDTMVPTDYMAFSTSQIFKEHLPKESWWHWNQSNSKVERHYNETKVVLQKFNTRLKSPEKKNNKISYKLWLYTIYNKDNSHVSSFIWCEKGLAPMHPFQNFSEMTGSLVDQINNAGHDFSENNNYQNSHIHSPKPNF